MANPIDLQARQSLDSTTTTANSAIKLNANKRAVVELDPDHPGFRDAEYRERRNQIAQIALDYVPGSPVPDAPYVDAEHNVWQEVCRQLAPAHARWACREYKEAFMLLGLPTKRLPQLREVSNNLQRLSGFRLEPAGGLVDPKVFMSTLSENIFLATQYIRHPSSPLYTPEPDVVHELIGHAVMLSSPLFAEINRLVGQAALRCKTDDDIERLGRIYWFTIEFGVAMEDGQPKAFGAGLLSSAGELENLAHVELRPFDLTEIESSSYDVTIYQPFLFCAESTHALFFQLREHLRNWGLH